MQHNQFILLSDLPYVAGGVLNSCVHVVMYSYYFLSTFSSLKRLTTLVKPLLTGLQIIQLVICLVHYSYMILRSNCQQYIFSLVFVDLLMLIFLFVRFFKKSYKKNV